MSKLGPAARALLEEASRQEALPTDEMLSRMHRTVLRRATSGAALALAASFSTKAAAVLGGIATQVVAFGLAGAIVGAAVVSFAPAPRAQPPNVAMANAAPPARRTVANRGATIEVPVAEPREPPRDDNPTMGDPTMGDVKQPSEIEAAEPPRGSAGAPRVARPSSAPHVSDSPVSKPHSVEPLAANAPELPAEPRAPRRATNLAAQLEILHQVHSALRARAGARALELLQLGAPMLEGSVLEEEASAARISALCQLARDVEARVEMARFVTRWPSSPLGARMLSGQCESAPTRIR